MLSCFKMGGTPKVTGRAPEPLHSQGPPLGTPRRPFPSRGSPVRDPTRGARGCPSPSLPAHVTPRRSRRPPRDPMRAHVTPPPPPPARAPPSGRRPPHLAGPLHGVGEGVLADPRAAPARGLRGTTSRPPARAAAAWATAAAAVPRARRARWRASPGATGSPGSPAPACGRRRPGRGSSRAVVRHGAAGPGLARRLKLRRRRRWRRLNAGTRPRSTRPRSTLGTQRLGRLRGGRGTPPPAAPRRRLANGKPPPLHGHQSRALQASGQSECRKRQWAGGAV